MINQITYAGAEDAAIDDNERIEGEEGQGTSDDTSHNESPVVNKDAVGPGSVGEPARNDTADCVEETCKFE